MKRLKSILIVIVIFVSGMIVGGVGGSAATFNNIVNDTFRDGPVSARRILVKHAKHELRLDEDQTHQFWQIINETGAELREVMAPVQPQVIEILERAEMRLRAVLRPEQENRFTAFMTTARTRWSDALNTVADVMEKPSLILPNGPLD